LRIGAGSMGGVPLSDYSVVCKRSGLSPLLFFNSHPCQTPIAIILKNYF
jgi:hypothetical protein